MPTLEERVQRLEDIEDIRRLKIRYAQFCDAQSEASPQFQMLWIWCKIPALGEWSPVWQESRHGDEAQEGGEEGRA
jgi:hypothetical protein